MTQIRAFQRNSQPIFLLSTEKLNHASITKYTAT